MSTPENPTSLTGYFEIEEAFTPNECLKITQLIGHKQISTIQSKSNTQTSLNPTIRNSIYQAIENIKENHWIYQRIHEIVSEVNQDFYQFHIQSLKELQLLEYQVGHFYDWHLDLGAGPLASRKLSIICFLTSNDEYDGGQLRFFGDKTRLVQEQGKVIVFPAYMGHKVEKVTRGIRHTLVAWAHGPAFR